MEPVFDPYHKWLGIPPTEQPPNHYRLLGIPLFEPDPDVIDAASYRQMAHLRTYQMGKHAELSQRLLNEVAGARICLLDARKKAAYDAEFGALRTIQALEAELAALECQGDLHATPCPVEPSGGFESPPLATAMSSIYLEPHSATPVVPVIRTRPARAIRHRVSKPNHPRLVSTFLAIASAILVAGLLVFPQGAPKDSVVGRNDSQEVSKTAIAKEVGRQLQQLGFAGVTLSIRWSRTPVVSLNGTLTLQNLVAELEHTGNSTTMVNRQILEGLSKACRIMDSSRGPTELAIDSEEDLSGKVVVQVDGGVDSPLCSPLTALLRSLHKQVVHRAAGLTANDFDESRSVIRIR